MFSSCEYLTSLDVSSFNTANVTDMNSMFFYCYSLKTLDVSSFNTANVTDMSNMFSGCKALKTFDLRTFNTSKVEDFSYMFNYSPSLTTILCNDDWSKNPNVKKSEYMFRLCNKLKGRRGTKCDGENDIDVSYARPDGVGGPGYFTNVAETYSVFDEQTGILTYYYDGIRASRNGICEFYEPDGNYVSHFEDYADQIKKAVIDQSFKYAPCTSLAAMFYGGNNDKTLSALETIEGLENINYAEVTSMYCMFKGCSSLKELSLYPFYDAVNVTEMSNMFEDCSSLQTLDLRYLLNTSKVTSMFRMFAGCSKLQKVLVSSLNTSNVTDMGGMFDGCSSLTALDLRSFNTENVEWMSYMFRGCYSLKSLDLR
jgi:surface protein